MRENTSVVMKTRSERQCARIRIRLCVIRFACENEEKNLTGDMCVGVDFVFESDIAKFVIFF